MNLRKIGIITFLITMILATAGCQSEVLEKKENGTINENFSGEIFFAGSSTLAPTISQIADEFKNQYGTWNNIDSTLPSTPIEISVSTGGSGAGAKAVIDGTATFGMLARGARDTEKNEMKAFNEALIGIDALLMAVSHDNALVNIKNEFTQEELVRIFSGELVNWSDIDASLPEEEILLLVRDLGGGAHEVFQKAIMGDTDVSVAALEVGSMSNLVERLINNPYAIGYASYGVSEAHKDQLVSFPIDGVHPTKENIINGTYTVSRPLILVWDGELSVAEQAFLDYILSEHGNTIIEEMGFLSTN